MGKAYLFTVLAMFTVTAFTCQRIIAKEEARQAYADGFAAASKQDECQKAYGIDCATYAVVIGSAARDNKRGNLQRFMDKF